MRCLNVLYYSFLFVLITNPVFSKKTDIYIGCLLQSIGRFGYSPDALGIEKAIDFLNRQPNILPEYNLVVLKNFTTLVSTGEGDALNILYDFIYREPKIMMLFLTGSSMIAKPICDVASLYNLVQVSATASSLAFSNKEKYPLFLRTTPTDAAFITAWEALFREFKWKRVAIIFQNVEIFTLLMKELVSVLRSRGIYEILTLEHVESGVEPIEQMQSVKRHDARIIVALGYARMSRRIMCQAYRTGQYGPKYVWMLLGWLVKDWYRITDGTTDTCTLDEMLTVLDGHIAVKAASYAADFNDVNFYGMLPNGDDIETYNFMRSYHYYTGFVYDAMVSIALALNTTDRILSELGHHRSLPSITQNVSMANILKEAILDLNFPGVSGVVQLTDTGDRISDIIIEQKQGTVGERVHVGRFSVEGDNFEWYADAPLSWRAAGKKPPTDGVHEIDVIVKPLTKVRIAMYVMASVGILFALVCLTLNIAYRKKKVIKISSPFLNNFIAMGGVILYVLVILFGIDTSGMSSFDFTVQCHLRPFLFSLGISLAFGAIFMKTYRVFAIFKIAMMKFKQIRVGDRRLILGVIAMVTLDVVISACWMILDPMSSTKDVLQTVELTDENGHDFRYIYVIDSCTSEYFLVWMMILYVYKASLLLFGVFLAYEIRSVTIESLNESKQISLSIYVVVLTSFISTPVQYFMSDDVTFVFGFTCVSIFGASTVVLGLSFVPKMIALRKGEDHIKISTMKTPSSTMDKDREVRILTEKLHEKAAGLASLEDIHGRITSLLIDSYNF